MDRFGHDARPFASLQAADPGWRADGGYGENAPSSWHLGDAAARGRSAPPSSAWLLPASKGMLDGSRETSPPRMAKVLGIRTVETPKLHVTEADGYFGHPPGSQVLGLETRPSDLEGKRLLEKQQQFQQHHQQHHHHQHQQMKSTQQIDESGCPSWLSFILEDLAARLDRQQGTIDVLVANQVERSVVERFAECMDRQQAQVDGILRSQAASAMAKATQPIALENLEELRQSLDRFRQEYRAGLAGFTVATGALQQDVADLSIKVAGLPVASPGAQRNAPSRDEFSALAGKVDGLVTLGKKVEKLEGVAVSAAAAQVAPLRAEVSALGALFNSLAAASQALPAAVAQPVQVAAAQQTRGPEVVIFLDIDGVLHSLYGDDLFNESCLALLTDVIKMTGASVVLSSTWRTDAKKISMINGVFKDRGLAEVIDGTPELPGQRREAEICAWLDAHSGVKSWIAIDDMDLESGGLDRMRGHFVRTNQDVGIVEKDAQLALQFLQHQLDEAGQTVAAAVPAPRTYNGITYTPQTGPDGSVTYIAVAQPVLAEQAPLVRMASSLGFSWSSPGMMQVTAAAPAQSMTYDQFDMFDRNHDGQVTRQEFQQATTAAPVYGGSLQMPLSPGSSQRMTMTSGSGVITTLPTSRVTLPLMARTTSPSRAAEPPSPSMSMSMPQSARLVMSPQGVTTYSPHASGSFVAGPPSPQHASGSFVAAGPQSPHSSGSFVAVSQSQSGSFVVVPQSPHASGSFMAVQ